MSVTLRYAGIVTRCNLFAAERIRRAEQFAPFDMRVTEHAGIGRPPVHVLVRKVLNNMAAEDVAVVQDMMLKA